MTHDVTSNQSPVFPATVFPPLTPEITTIDDAVTAYPDTELRYAVDGDMGEITWTPQREIHTLVSGQTGSGKTALIHTLIVDATRRGWEVVVIASEGIGYTRYRDWPNVSMVITEIEQVIAVINHLHRVLEHRVEQADADYPAAPQVTPMLIVIDDYTEFIARVSRFYDEHKREGDPRQCPTMTQFITLLRLSRLARMHVLAGIQRLDLQSMPLDANFGHRVSLGPLSPQQATVMWHLDAVWHSETVGSHIPVGVPGRGIARNHAGEPVEVQCYFTPSPVNEDDPHLRHIAEQLRPTVSLYPRKVVAPPTPVDDEEGPVPFAHFRDAGIHLATDRPDLDPLAPRHRS